jgi:hypothetical protein
LYRRRRVVNVLAAHGADVAYQVMTLNPYP